MDAFHLSNNKTVLNDQPINKGDSLPRLRKPYLSIRPSTGWAALNLQQIWQFKDLLLTFAERDVKLRYRQTALGVLWVILQPLMAAGIFSFVFGKVAAMPSDGLPYFIFAYAGLLGWNAFSSTFTKASNCLVQHSGLISKIFFPRLILPLSTTLSTFIDFGVALALMAVVMVVRGINPGIGILLLPVWLLLIVMLGLGLGLFAATLMVAYRDVQFVLPVLVPFVMYASPVAYAVSAVPEHLRTFYFLNPLSGLLEAFRWSLLGRGEMTWNYVAYSAIMTTVIFVSGAFYFKKMERRFADVI
jgi:lipopolysaccharide transport system permease protein